MTLVFERMPKKMDATYWGHEFVLAKCAGDTLDVKLVRGHGRGFEGFHDEVSKRRASAVRVQGFRSR